MKIWNKLRAKVFPVRCRHRERVRAQVALPPEAPVLKHIGGGFAEAPEPQRPELNLDREIDFSGGGDLEAYTEDLHVPQESIERWISAGLLYPDEIRTAERMIKIIRKKDELARVA